jgi:polycomb protein EED
MRFKLHFVPNQHPVLAFCNAGGNIFFWDFKRLSIYSDFIKKLGDHDPAQELPRRPSWLRVIQHRQRDAGGKARHPLVEKDSPAPSQTGDEGKKREDTKEFSVETLESWADKYSMDNPHKALQPHKIEFSAANFVGRQAAWSPGGEWCVVVGSDNQAMVLQRWGKTKPQTKHQKPVGVK